MTAKRTAERKKAFGLSVLMPPVSAWSPPKQMFREKDDRDHNVVEFGVNPLESMYMSGPTAAIGNEDKGGALARKLVQRTRKRDTSSNGRSRKALLKDTPKSPI